MKKKVISDSGPATGEEWKDDASGPDIGEEEEESLLGEQGAGGSREGDAGDNSREKKTTRAKSKSRFGEESNIGLN